MPPSVTITLFEKVTYLRGQSASNNDVRGRRRNVLDEQDSQPSQLRGLVTVHIPKPTRIKSVELTLSGQGRTDWPEGIGNNRVELAETTQFFKEQITLFDAKAETAPAPPLRRSHSVGPGIGLSDDVDWEMIAGDGSPHGNGSEDRAVSTALTKAFQATAKKTSDKDAAAQFARSAGKFAAKASTAILPPTLLRELAGARPDKQGSSASGSKKPKDKQHKSATQSQSQPTSPVQARSPNHHMIAPPAAPPLPPPMYVATPPADSDGSSYFSARGPQHSSSSSSPGATSPLHSPQLGPPPLSPALPPQSISAAGPHGRSILQAPRRGRAAEQQQLSTPPSSDLLSSSTPVVDAASSDGLAGFSPTASPPTLRAQPAAANMVRFDSGAPIVNTITPRTPQPPSQPQPRPPPPPGRRRGSSASGIVFEPPSCAPAPAATSAPTSRRTSIDASASPGTRKDKGKGKSVGNSEGSGKAPVKLPGLKDILSGRRRDDAGLNAKKDKSASRRRSTDTGPGSASRLPSSSAASSSGSPSPANSFTTNSHAPLAAPQYHQATQDWREFKKGTYTYSISLPLPANLPPTIHADFGRNTYTLKACVRRSGPLTPNFSCEREVVLVHAPDEEGTEETEAVVVERTWEEALTYRVFVSGRSFACGSTIPLWVKFIPLGEKVKLWRITATLEERTHYYAKGRKVSRRETPRKTALLKVVDPDGKPLLPIISDSPDALASSPLAEHAIAAAGQNVPPEMRRNRRGGATPNGSNAASASSSRALDDDDDDDDDEEEEEEEVGQDALATLLDPAGPWELAMNLQLPGKNSRVNITTDHERSCITVSHSLRLVFRVERVIQGENKLFDIVIEAPIKINHSHTAEAWLSLPNYWSVATSPLAEALEGGSAGDGYFSGDHHRHPRRDATTAGSSRSSLYASTTGTTTPAGAATPGGGGSAGATPAASPPRIRGGGNSPGPTTIGASTSVASPPPPPPPSATSPGSPPSGALQTNANEWLALSIARNQQAGRTDRMVAFADGGSAGELPPPYTANDDGRAATGAGSEHSSSSGTSTALSPV